MVLWVGPERKNTKPGKKEKEEDKEEPAMMKRKMEATWLDKVLNQQKEIYHAIQY